MHRMLIPLLALTLTGTAIAKGEHGSGSHMPSYGTGAKSEHSHVHGYVKKDGTYVAPHDKSTPDHTKNNNWDTKGNYNPETGKAGTKRGDE